MLRALVRQHGSAEQAALLHRLVSLSDEERERLIADFWADVSEGLNDNPRFVAELNSAPPRLPDEPTPEQLDAWIELAALVSDPRVRSAVRADLNERFTDGPGHLLVSPDALKAYERAVPLIKEAVAAQQAGLAPDSPPAQELGDRYLRRLGGMFGASFDDATNRRQLAEGLLLMEPQILADQEREANGPRPTDPYERYQLLVQMVDGTLDANHAELAGYAAANTWLAAVLDPTATAPPE
ncbi:hypothetical protein [Streptomyces xiamenensis]|uniref:hypothetical protein n=1 Tax=Streptomyces xiamenensis TaxID=408015 RepID=UPI003446FD45